MTCPNIVSTMLILHTINILTDQRLQNNVTTTLLEMSTVNRTIWLNIVKRRKAATESIVY